MPLFFIFVLVPLIELYILLEVGAVIGAGVTFLIIIATAFIGTRLVKQQGTSTWQSIQQQMQQGQLPAERLFDGICILVSGVLLITPGFLTDIVGMLLLTPPFRSAMYQQVGRHIKVKAASAQHGSFDRSAFQQSPFEQQSPFKQQGVDENPRQGETLDGEYQRKD